MRFLCAIFRYLDYLRQVNHDFLQADRTTPAKLRSTQDHFLESEKMKIAQTILYDYFEAGYSALENQLETYIEDSF